MDADVRSRYECACRWSVEGGRTTLNYFQRSNFQVELKGDQSPVTIADRNAEEFIRAKIAEQFPSDAIVGEEFGTSEGNSGYRWILDPIDGTKSFIHGVPLYGTMIGIEFQSAPVIGAIYFPGLDEGIFGCRNQPTVFGRDKDLKEAKVSQVDRLDQALFVTTDSESFASRDAADVYSSLANQCLYSRTWGDCYGYYLVATGRAEFMIDPMLSIWDAAAVAPIVEGAGGKFTDWQGQSRIDGGEGIGSNPKILSQVLEITRSAAPLKS